MIPNNHIFLMWSSCIYEWKNLTVHNTCTQILFLFSSHNSAFQWTARLFASTFKSKNTITTFSLVVLIRVFSFATFRIWSWRYSNSNIGKGRWLRIVWNLFWYFFTPHIIIGKYKLQIMFLVTCISTNILLNIGWFELLCYDRWQPFSFELDEISDETRMRMTLLKIMNPV